MGQCRGEAPQSNTPGDTSKIYIYPPMDQIYHYSHKYAFPRKYRNIYKLIPFIKAPPPPPPHINTSSRLYSHSYPNSHSRTHT